MVWLPVTHLHQHSGQIRVWISSPAAAAGTIPKTSLYSEHSQFWNGRVCVPAPLSCRLLSALPTPPTFAQQQQQHHARREPFTPLPCRLLRALPTPPTLARGQQPQRQRPITSFDSAPPVKLTRAAATPGTPPAPAAGPARLATLPGAGLSAGQRHPRAQGAEGSAHLAVGFQGFQGFRKSQSDVGSFVSHRMSAFTEP